MGPVSDAAAICSADSVQSVSPRPVKHGPHPHVEVACAAAVRLAYRVRHGRVRQGAPQEPALMTAGSAGSGGHPTAGLRGGLVARK